MVFIVFVGFYIIHQCATPAVKIGGRFFNRIKINPINYNRYLPTYSVGGFKIY